MNKDRQVFEHSPELKRLFNQLFEQWSRKNRLGLEDLAQRCGVSSQYLAHIGRYGRVPGKPILILLAFNLEVQDPGAFFRAALVKEPWPYETGIGIRPRGAAESGFLSVNLDMPGFAAAIREIVRSEIRPKTLDELLNGRPLKVGINPGQDFLLSTGAGKSREGFFPELMQLLALAMHCEIQFKDVPHTQFAESLRLADIDVYGPVYFTPNRMTQALFSRPFCKVKLAGVRRLKEANVLPPLPHPKKLADLRKKDYRIAVHADSMSHHLALGELGIPEERLVICESPEESIERILLTSIPRPAHILLTDYPHAVKIQKDNSDLTEMVLNIPDPEAPPYEDTIAVRHDWPSVAALLNDTLGFLERNGSVARLFQRTINPEDSSGIIVS